MSETAGIVVENFSNNLSS